MHRSHNISFPPLIKIALYLSFSITIVNPRVNPFNYTFFVVVFLLSEFMSIEAISFSHCIHIGFSTEVLPLCQLQSDLICPKKKETNIHTNIMLHVHYNSSFHSTQTHHHLVGSTVANITDNFHSVEWIRYSLCLLQFVFRL